MVVECISKIAPLIKIIFHSYLIIYGTITIIYLYLKKEWEVDDFLSRTNLHGPGGVRKLPALELKDTGEGVS